MQNVITIDFDIIMQPSINFYNDMVGDDVLLSQLLEDHPQLENSFNADLYIYQYFTRLITKYCKQNVPIHFISNHQDVIKYLSKYTEAVNVYNFDHHHDIGYGSIRWEKKITSLQCGNWAKYGVDAGMIKDYIWIHNENSGFPEKRGKEKYLTKEYLLKDFSNSNHDDLNPTEIIVCASWEWIPPIYNPLFNSWMAICEEMSGTEITMEGQNE